MTTSLKKSPAQEEAERLTKKYGNMAGTVGTEKFKLNVIPTGSLALDYALGTGGWPLGHPVHVFGKPDLGKSSVIGFNAIRNAQAEGKLCGIIAIEPGFDEAWAAKNGIDLERVVIARPDSGEEAFDMLYDWITGDIIDFVVFDSIGALVTEAELAQEQFKSRVGGQSSLITDGTKRILTPCWKKRKGVIYLNQVRDNMQARMPGVFKPPGGHALTHTTAIWVQIKSTGSPYKEKIGEDEVTVGRTLVAVIARNKLSEGSDRRAEFDFYQMATEEHPVGIDIGKDIVNTAIRTRVIEKAGGWFTHPVLPGEKHQLQGRETVYEYFAEHPSAVTKIRGEVLHAMLEREAKAKKKAAKSDPEDG